MLEYLGILKPKFIKGGKCNAVLETHDKGKTCMIDESPLLPT